MTKQQKQKILDIIKKDSQIANRYCVGGKTCVIGGLLKEIGWTDAALAEGNEKRISSAVTKMKDLIDHYGIDWMQAVRLQITNDEDEGALNYPLDSKLIAELSSKPELIKARRERLTKLVESWNETES